MFIGKYVYRAFTIVPKYLDQREIV